MINSETYQKPLLIQTGRGFSVLYRNKYLYSKYNPQATISAQCASLVIPNSTLLVCFSPLLGYGLEQLFEKLPASSYLLAVECDQNLMRLSLDSGNFSIFAGRNFSYIRTNSVPEVLRKVETLPLFPFKKCITLSLSGGTQLYTSFYDSVARYVEDLISGFWKNRITLMQLGRNYVHNTFRNLLSLKECTADASRMCRLRLLKGSERIDKPVLVVGAGPSLDSMRTFIRTYRSLFFLLAVDAAAPALLPDIIPDAIVLVESQYWIDSVFIGLKSYQIPVFADITASPRALKASGGQVYFFCTEYARLQYLARLYQALKPLILQPMGSVGLMAVQLALALTVPTIPVLHIGLDFAWRAGLTHAAESSVAKKLFAETNRIQSLYSASACVDMQRVTGKQEDFYWTRPILARYAALYRQAFCGVARIIDVSPEGCMLNTRKADVSEIVRILIYCESHDAGLQAAEHAQSDSGNGDQAPCLLKRGLSLTLQESTVGNRSTHYNLISAYLAEELQRLTALHEYLREGVPLSEKQAEQLIAECDYLYSHFPDAARGYSLDSGFLKRTSIELRYLLKILC